MSLSAAKRLALLSALLLCAPALAQPHEHVPESLEGVGRISLSAGWRHTPNDLFRRRLTEAGFTPGAPSRGGPALVGEFGYSVNPVIEIAIDLLAGGEQLALEGADTLTSVSYGGLFALRFQTALGGVGPIAQLIPSIGFATGGLLVNVDGPIEPSEAFAQAFVLSGGLTARLSASWGVGLTYRFLLARGAVTGIGSINAGGSWATIGVTYFFPPDPSAGQRGLPAL